MRTFPLLALSLLATGCSMGGPSGIWMIQYTPVVTDEDPCETTGTENFSNVDFPEDITTEKGDWTETVTREVSDMLLFVQIETTASGEAVLLLGNAAYPGTNDGGTWTFKWDAATANSDVLEHVDGYQYTEASESTDSTVFTIEPKGDTATGLIKSNSDQTQSWSESDEWDADATGVSDGSIPADMLENSEGQPGRNTSDRAECDAPNCQIAMATTCQASQDFSAIKTDYDDEDAYDYLMSSGQGGL